jgi:hypothetical protein
MDDLSEDLPSPPAKHGLHSDSPTGDETASRRPDWMQIAAMITSLATVAAVVFTAYSLRVTRDQIGIAAEGQITNRYTQAVQLLGTSGDDNRNLRLGGIYSLERIANDSSRDTLAIFRLLVTFIRNQTTVSRPPSECPGKAPATDIAAALQVFASTKLPDDNPSLPEGPTFDLSESCLALADVQSINLERAALNKISLVAAYLGSAKMHGVKLTSANLTDADLPHADLTKADLRRTTLSGADLSGADLSGADLRATDLRGTIHDAGTLIDGAIVDEHTRGAWW